MYEVIKEINCRTDHSMVIEKCKFKLKSQIKLRRKKKPKRNLEFLREDATRRKYVKAVSINLGVENE
jgi:hypothetical protein